MDTDPTSTGHSRYQQFLTVTYYLISWLAAVHQISEENGILGTGQSASRHLARTLLDADTLVVLIDGLHKTKKITVPIQPTALLKAQLSRVSDLTAGHESHRDQRAGLL